MALRFFRPFMKDFGAQFTPLTNGSVTASASATATFGLGALSDKDDTKEVRQVFVDEVFVASAAKPAGGDTIVLNVFKYDASAGSAVTLVDAFDLTSLTAGKADRAPIVSTLTEAQRTLDAGDFLYGTVVAAGTVTTNLSGGSVTAMLKVIR